MAPGKSAPARAKPCRVIRHRLSTPPTTAASQIPAAISWCASAKARPLEAQAVDTTDAGPRRPSAALTKRATENMSWVWL